METVFGDKLLDEIGRTGDFSVLSEAKLDEMEMKREKLPEDYVRVSQTLTWFANRQKSMDAQVEKLRAQRQSGKADRDSKRSKMIAAGRGRAKDPAAGRKAPAAAKEDDGPGEAGGVRGRRIRVSLPDIKLPW